MGRRKPLRVTPGRAFHPLEKLPGPGCPKARNIDCKKRRAGRANSVKKVGGRETRRAVRQVRKKLLIGACASRGKGEMAIWMGVRRECGKEFGQLSWQNLNVRWKDDFP